MLPGLCDSPDRPSPRMAVSVMRRLFPRVLQLHQDKRVNTPYLSTILPSNTAQLTFHNCTKTYLRRRSRRNTSCTGVLQNTPVSRSFDQRKFAEVRPIVLALRFTKPADSQSYFNSRLRRTRDHFQINFDKARHCLLIPSPLRSTPRRLPFVVLPFASSNLS